MKTILSAVLVAAITLAGLSSVWAQNQYLGVDIFATGDNPPLEGFLPGTSAPLQLKDDGTGSVGATAGDGIYTLDYQITSSSAAMLNQRVQWKVASSGFTPVSYPPGIDNSFTRYVLGTTKFIFDTNAKNDGFVPDPNGTNIQGILYTVPSPIIAGDVLRATGSYNSEIGGGTGDFKPASPNVIMNDAGTAPDVAAGDGIYSFGFTAVPPGNYEFKITVNGTFDLQVSAIGYATGGPNLALTVGASTDNVSIFLDSATGRVKVLNDNPTVSPGPPFYGTSDAWGDTGLNANTQLFDDGTNGDVTSGDGIHSRVLTTVASGSFQAQVKQGVGPSYPGTSGYPIDIATTGQLVLLQFDTNTLTDGYIPDTRYMWTDPLSRHLPSAVQAVGTFQTEFGGVSDYNANDPNFNLSDAGSSGDITASDAVYGLDFTAFTAAPGAQYKAVIPPGFEYQFGGAGDGYTRFGNNPAIVFSANGGDTVNVQVDSVTGRIAVFVATPETLPTRPASINALPIPSAVNDWKLY